MNPVKNRWLVIFWNGAAWERHTKMTDNFRDHKAEFDALVDTAHMHEPPIDARRYKSIHTCWLDDIANWESPFESEIVQTSTPHPFDDLPQEVIEDAALRAKDNFGAPEPRGFTIDMPPGISRVMGKLVHPLGRDFIAHGQIHVDIDDLISKLSVNDAREFRNFKRYLRARQKYGEAVLLKRPFWRKYLGVK